MWIYSYPSKFFELGINGKHKKTLQCTNSHGIPYQCHIGRCMKIYLYPQATQHLAKYHIILLWFSFLLKSKKSCIPEICIFLSTSPKNVVDHPKKILTVTTQIPKSLKNQVSQASGEGNLSKLSGPCVYQSCNTTSLDFGTVGNRDFCLVKLLFRFQN